MKDFQPICLRFIKETETGLKYEFQDREVDLSISFSDRKLAVDFLYLCNGKEKFEAIAKALNVKLSKLIPLVNILIKHNIIFDSRELFRFYRQLETIPGQYQSNSKKSNGNNFKPGKSQQLFGEEAIQINQTLKILNELSSFYSEKCPLDFFILLNQNSGKYSSGLYKLSQNGKELISLHKKSSVKINKFLFTSDITVNSSIIIFVIVKKINHSHPNRGYRHLFLESGRVVQKVFELATKEKINFVERSDFNDKAVSTFLNLDEDLFCSTTLILGTKNKKNNSLKQNQTEKSQEVKVSELRNFLTKKKYIRNMEVKSYFDEKYIMQKYATMATSLEILRSNRTYTTCGVAETIIESELKCLVEMYERYACSILRTDREIIYKNQKNFFSITVSDPQSKLFLNKKKLVQIEHGQKVKCVNAIGLLDNKKYLVPVDEVFYPIKEAIFYKANSSGVAAHYDKDLAIKNAFYELIERDAVLVTWYARKIPNILDNNFLSDDLKQRVANLEKKKVKVDFLDLTLDSCGVILCLIHNYNYPKTTIGCSANIDIDKAIEKSLDEAELMLNTWHEEADSNRLVKVEDVENTIDHGNIFARVNLKNSKYKWLLGGVKIKQIKQPIRDFDELIKKFEPKLIDINRKKDLGLHVVRVMSQKLLPLTFGYGGEHYGHSRLKELDLNWGSEYPLLPHFIP